MRKEGVLVVCLFLVLSIGLVSAGLFDYKPFKDQPGITGKAVSPSYDYDDDYNPNYVPEDECNSNSDCGILWGIFSKNVCTDGSCVDPEEEEVASISLCGNGRLDADEECDGTRFASGFVCYDSEGYPASSCNSNCEADDRYCVGETTCTFTGYNYVNNACRYYSTSLDCGSTNPYTYATLYQCENANACVPQCSGKQCGDDGCGNSCGSCSNDESCSSAGQCVSDSTCGNNRLDSGEECDIVNSVARFASGVVCYDSEGYPATSCASSTCLADDRYCVGDTTCTYTGANYESGRCARKTSSLPCGSDNPYEYTSLSACEDDHATCTFTGYNYVSGECEYGSSTLSCDSSNPYRYISLSRCESANLYEPECGNGRLDAGEECDGTRFASGFICYDSEGYPASSCNSNCEADDRYCVGDTTCTYTGYNYVNNGCRYYSTSLDCGLDNPYDYVSLSACEAAHSDEPECTSDYQCPGDEICDTAGECVDPPSNSCTSSNSNAQYCGDCEECVGANHYWDDYEVLCFYSSFPGAITSLGGCMEDGTCNNGNDCASGEVCVANPSMAEASSQYGICVSSGSLSSYNGQRCSDNGYSLMNALSGMVAVEEETFRASGPHVCAKGTVTRNDADTYFESCAYGGQSASTGFWPGDVCDRDVRSSFSVDGICINTGWGSNYQCNTGTVCADGGAGNYYSGCSSCDNGDACDLNGGLDGWDALCYRSSCFETDEDFECVNDDNCGPGETCEGFRTSTSGIWGTCVSDPDNDCVPCTDLGYYGGGQACEDDAGLFDISSCTGCTDDRPCELEGNVCHHGVARCGPEFCTSDDDCINNPGGYLGNLCLSDGTCVQAGGVEEPECVVDQDCIDLGLGNACSGGSCLHASQLICYIISGEECFQAFDSQCGSSYYSSLAQCRAALNNNNCGDGTCSLAETSCPQDCITGYSSGGGPPDPPQIPTGPSDDDEDSGDVYSVPLPNIPTPGTISIGLAITGMAVAPTSNSFCGDNICTYDETTCSVDCPGTVTPPNNPVCGDYVCEGSESYSNCPSDCSPSCTPNCYGSECGSDGCGGSCGSCGYNERCSGGTCVDNGNQCTPNCNGRECGTDGCSGSCGSCGGSEYCNSGTCVTNPNPNVGPPSPPVIPTFGQCGDGSCIDGETCSSCPQDCGTCPSNGYCGDGACVGETCSSCPGDCGTCGNNGGPSGPPTPPLPPIPGTNPQTCTGTPPNGQDCSSQITNGNGVNSIICNTNTAQWEQGPCVRSSCINGYEPGGNNNCVVEGTGGVVAPPTPPLPPIPNPQTCTGTPPGTQDCSSQIANGNGQTVTTCNAQTGQWEVGPCVVSSCNNGYTPTANNAGCVVGTNTGNLNECYLLVEGDLCIYANSNVLCAHTNAHPTLEMCEGANGICGNGVLDENEICDGGLVNPTAAHLNCESFGFGFGPLKCNDVCRLDASDCNLDCYDDDDGLELLEKGKVIFNGNEYYDTCDDGGNLLEQFCINVLTSEGLTVFGKAEKAFSCPKDTECFEGACVDENDIPWRPECSNELECENSDETCVEGKCVPVNVVTDVNYCENNVCFFDTSFGNGVNFEYGDADYFITYMDSSNGKVTLKVAEITDRAGTSGFAKIENKELSTGVVNHVMGLAIDVLDADLTSAKIRILQFSCLNEEICLGNFECSGVDVCAAPGAFCIISNDCNTGERCSAGVCLGGNNQSQNPNNQQQIEGLCKLKSGEVAYCAYNGKTYQVGRKLGCKFILSSPEITEEEFVLGALEKKEFSTGVSVKRDVNHCGSQYLSLRFEDESDVEEPECVVDADCTSGPYGDGSGECHSGSCTYNGLPVEYCGDGLCDNSETRSSCPQDCGEPSTDFCDYGCFEDNNCYPIGYRKGGDYCGIQNNFIDQRNSEEGVNTPCDNSFECSSNLCIDGNCVSGGFMNRIFGVFRDLFSSS